MIYREAGQFRTSYAQDSQIFALRQDRFAMLALLVVAPHSHDWTPSTRHIG